MPVTYTIDATRRLIHTICSQPLRFADVVGHFRTLNRDPACNGYLDVLLDVSDADLLPNTGQFGPVIEELRLVRQKVDFGLCAVVATRDAMFGMMRMFEVFASSYFREMRVFRTMADAEAWLKSEQSEAKTSP